jgi:hypothetical protein
MTTTANQKVKGSTMSKKAEISVLEQSSGWKETSGTAQDHREGRRRESGKERKRKKKWEKENLQGDEENSRKKSLEDEQKKSCLV